jgi:Flp pilus assembly protein TadD
MKSVLRVVLFSLIAVPVAACSGDRDVPAPTSSIQGSSMSQMPMPSVIKPEAPVVEPSTPKPVAVVEPIAIPTTYAEALELGKQLVVKGDQSRAKEVLEAAIKLDRKQADPHIELARMYITSGERAAAIKSANKAVKLAPGSSQAYNTLGRAELARFDYDKAIEAFQMATELNPDNVWAWNNLGFTELQLAHYQKAADALVEATTRKGATGYMFNNLGTAYEHLDQLDDARVAFEQGGELGSAEATSSRRRLEGVETIVVMKTAPIEKAYDTREEMPEDVVGADPVEVEEVEEVAPDVTIDVKVDDVKVDDVDDEPKPDPAPVSPLI